MREKVISIIIEQETTPSKICRQTIRPRLHGVFDGMAQRGF